MYNIKEGIISSVSEILKVSKQISNPFQSYLKRLKSIKIVDNIKNIRKPLDKFINIINSSKMSIGMKNRFIKNMYIDIYKNINDEGSLNGRQIQKIMGWNDDIYISIIKDL